MRKYCDELRDATQIQGNDWWERYGKTHVAHLPNLAGNCVRELADEAGHERHLQVELVKILRLFSAQTACQTNYVMQLSFALKEQPCTCHGCVASPRASTSAAQMVPASPEPHTLPCNIDGNAHKWLCCA